MKANTFLAPALAVAMLTSACTGANEQPPRPVEYVQLDHSLAPEAQAEQIEVALNAGKMVTGATVEVGFKISLQDPCKVYYDSELLSNPVMVAPDAYLYVEDRPPGQDGLDVGVVRYNRKLEDLPALERFSEEPHEVTDARLSAVFNQLTDQSGSTDKYYTVSFDQEPGRNNNDPHSPSISSIAWSAKDGLTGFCGIPPGEPWERS